MSPQHITIINLQLSSHFFITEINLWDQRANKQHPTLTIVNSPKTITKQNRHYRTKF